MNVSIRNYKNSIWRLENLVKSIKKDNSNENLIPMLKGLTSYVDELDCKLASDINKEVQKDLVKQANNLIESL